MANYLDGEEVIDFYHVPGTSTQPSRLPMATPIRSAVAQFEKQRHVLDYGRGESDPFVHLRDTYPRRKKIARELKYFRRESAS